MTDSDFETTDDPAADADDAADAAAEGAEAEGPATPATESLRLERRARKSLRLARRTLEESSASPEELARQTTAESQVYALLSLANAIREANLSPDANGD